MLPERFIRIDARGRVSHRLLRPDDQVYYLGEYAAGAGYVAPVNGLIRNFKIKPSSLQRSPVRRRHKEGAIREIAVALTRHFSGLDPSAVIVPIPTSKVPTDPDYDRRLLRALQVCRAELRLDVRELIKQKCSTAADHETTGRQSFRQLIANCYVDAALSAPRPSLIVLFDDVLAEGKHFKVCQRLLRDHYGEIPIVGCFIARSIQLASSPLVEPEEHLASSSGADEVAGMQPWRRAHARRPRESSAAQRPRAAGSPSDYPTATRQTVQQARQEGRREVRRPEPAR